MGVQAHGSYFAALLPEMIVALTALVLLLGDAFQRGRRAGGAAPWVPVLAVAGTAAALVANGWLAANPPADGGTIAVDAFRFVANFILLVGTLLAIVFSRDYLEREQLQIGEYYALMLLASVGMMTLVGARDLIVLFVGLELMSIAVYVLTGIDRSNPRSSEASLKYFLVGAFASAFLLYGIALLYGVAGTTDLDGLSSAIAATGTEDVLLYAGIALLLIGFAFKVAAVPFHMWTPDAYEGAPTPVTGFMAAGVKTAAAIAMLRVVTVHLFAAAEVWTAALAWLAMLTMVVPNLVALAQDSVKRMLAYSSVAHTGYLLVGVVAGTGMGRSATLFYLAAYTVMTLGAFAVVGALAGKGDARDRLGDYRGLGWRQPLLGLALVVFLLSLAGFPPTAGFVGKLYLLRAAVDSGHVALAVTLVLSSLVAYYYYLRVIWKMYFDEAPEEVVDVERPSGAFRLATVACALAVLMGGLLPGAAVHAVERASVDMGVGTPPLHDATGVDRTPGQDVAPEPAATARENEALRRAGS